MLGIYYDNHPCLKRILMPESWIGWLGFKPFIASKASHQKEVRMNRGVSYGGGQSSLGYLFGSGEAPKLSKANLQAVSNEGPAKIESSQKPTPPPQPVDITKQIPAGIHSNPSNNYFRADGQNCGNFLTDRPSTKVHSAPGGGSSLDYLFGGGRSGGN